jgi:undecaprenyl-diphosphatase
MPRVEILEAVFLGVVQGIAEFLPVSSSGHIVIFSELAQRLTGRTIDPDSNLQMNVALHLGTLISILYVYRADLLQLRRQRDLCLAIVIATLPVVVVGLILHATLRDQLDAPLVAGGGLLITALLLWAGPRIAKRHDTVSDITLGKAFSIGLFQAIALVPGISRSGSTIAGGMMNGLGPERAASFSFLIAIPAIAGAVVLTVKGLLEGEGGANSPTALLIGMTVSCIVGVVALKWLIRLVSKGRLHRFAWYCAAVGLGTIVWQLLEMMASA